jgi:hypothetical protein
MPATAAEREAEYWSLAAGVSVRSRVALGTTWKPLNRKLDRSRSIIFGHYGRRRCSFQIIG